MSIKLTVTAVEVRDHFNEVTLEGESMGVGIVFTMPDIGKAFKAGQEFSVEITPKPCDVIDRSIVLRSHADRVRSFADTPNDAVDAAETGYRRGYCHGYGQAMDDWMEIYRAGYVRPAEIFSMLAEHHYTEITNAWRYFRSGGWQPPSLKFRPWPEVRAEIFARDGRACALCGSDDNLQIDHIIPVKDGGLATSDNLRVLCRTCNCARNGSDD
jgi:5-methylcytosine-specific restriction endonuclease McrA